MQINWDFYSAVSLIHKKPHGAFPQKLVFYQTNMTGKQWL